MLTPHPHEPPDRDGKHARPAPTDVGGESACWAHLVCEECGALEMDGHRDGCNQVPSS